MTQKIAILGLGAMGARMARRLLTAGFDVTVYNRSEGRARRLEMEGARVASTPREAAEAAEIVLSMVTDDAASEAVWLHPEAGALLGLGAGKIAVECSTLSPGWVRAWAEAVAATGAGCLDAPVAGSRPQADAGALIFLVGGAGEAVARVTPALEVMGGAIKHLGPVGRGAAMKLAVNAYFSVQIAALAEVTATLSRSGFDAAEALDALATMPIMSPALKGVAGLMARADHAPRFPIDLVEKDLRYAVAAAEAVEVEPRLSAAARDAYAAAREAGLGGENISGVARLYGLNR